MSLEVRRTPMGEMEDADQGDEQDGRAQEDDGDYEVYSMVFCYDASAAQSYTICDGHSSWEYKSGGKTCKGKDKLVGEWGGCTEVLPLTLGPPPCVCARMHADMHACIYTTRTISLCLSSSWCD